MSLLDALAENLSVIRNKLWIKVKFPYLFIDP